MTSAQTAQAVLQEQFPGRAKEIACLLGLMGNPTDAVVPSIFVYGQPSVGKTSVIRALMETTLSRTSWAYVNCVERHTPRMLFEHALNQWCGWTPCWENQCTNVHKADTVLQFIKAIQQGVTANGTHIPLGVDSTLYLILDKAERLRDMPPSLLPVLLRLSEMTQRNVCVLLISTVVFEKFRVKGGSLEPFYLRFSDYTQQDILAILLLDFMACKKQKGTETSLEAVDGAVDSAFFMGFAEMVYSILHHNCRDLNELRYFSALLFPLYIEPLEKGEVQVREKAKLFRHIQPYLAEATGKLYLREISSAEWAKEAQALKEKLTPQEETVTMPLVPLPCMTLAQDKGKCKGKGAKGEGAFLLLASYLASYNPPRFDIRYFAKVGEERRRKKGGGTRKSRVGPAEGGKMRPQLLGPKAFPVERMLAIFYSIIDDALEDSVNIQLQITSLTSLRLLLRATSMDRLDSVKYKCNVSLELVRAVAKSVRFEIENYLYDFC
ncbi:origin recognition complex subunit 5 C-terminus-domain-containing protein [Spinellus fusiger]|nr:origin recognition complex subunit 5 C-terminus-domain-containing protein [Spinellus fusiger]